MRLYPKNNSNRIDGWCITAETGCKELNDVEDWGNHSGSLVVDVEANSLPEAFNKGYNLIMHYINIKSRRQKEIFKDISTTYPY